MTTLMKTVSLAMMAISISGCNTPVAKANAYKGRMIEFKSDAAGFDTRTFFYEGEMEVVAFDSQFTPELAEKSIQHLRTFTSKPIAWLVLTHPNPDKFNGASVFKREGARIVSSASTEQAIPGVHAYKEYYFVEMAKMFKKGSYPQPTRVDETFEGQMDLVLRGGEKISLRELSQPGVSSTQTVAYVQAVNALVVGDLIHSKAHAWLEGGIVNGKPVPTLKGWIADLKELTSLYPADALVYGGRGVTEKLKPAAEAQIHYLEKADKIVRAEIKRLGPNAKDFTGPNSAALYSELAKKFQAAFPDYALSYMIDYGAYGLVQSRL